MHSVSCPTQPSSRHNHSSSCPPNKDKCFRHPVTQPRQTKGTMSGCRARRDSNPQPPDARSGAPHWATCLSMTLCFRTWQDSNLQPPDPKSGALSVRPHALTLAQTHQRHSKIIFVAIALENIRRIIVPYLINDFTAAII